VIPGLSYVKLIGGLVAALILVALIADRGRWMHRAHNDEQQLSNVCDAVREAANRPKLDCKQMPQQIQFLGDALNDVRAKTETAKASDAAHAKEVETRQNTISQESSNDYQAELARVRADYAERLRRASAANSGGSGKPSVPGAAPSASGPDAAPAQGGLPAPDALTATEQALQLKAIQDWARKVGLAKE
jgi:hypothetical protein